jgi:hypothetical protein
VVRADLNKARVLRQEAIALQHQQHQQQQEHLDGQPQQPQQQSGTGTVGTKVLLGAVAMLRCCSCNLCTQHFALATCCSQHLDRINTHVNRLLLASLCAACTL